LKYPDELEVKVHCSGDNNYHSKLFTARVDMVTFVKYPGAFAVETEGTGLLSLKLTLGVLLCLLGDRMVIQ